MPRSRWAPGAPILLREVIRARIWTARPVTVVRDDRDLVALYLAPGARWKGPHGRDGRRLRVPTAAGDWVLREWVWREKRALILGVPGAAHTVWAFWSDPAGEFLGWYVNLQEPVRRTRFGFDYMDHMLDLEVLPDRSAWAWKDEAELVEMHAAGLLIDSELAAVRAEARRVVERVRSGSPPFDQGWEHWTPDPSWAIPELPGGWDRLDAVGDPIDPTEPT